MILKRDFCVMQVMVDVWSKDQCMTSGYPKVRLRGPILCAGNPSGGFDACQVNILYYSDAPLLFSKVKL